MARLGGTAVRTGLPLLKGPPRVPDPGQHVELLMEDGSWRRGFRAVSEPSTTELGEVVVWVATEDEYRAAQGRPSPNLRGVGGSRSCFPPSVPRPPTRLSTMVFLLR